MHARRAVVMATLGSAVLGLLSGCTTTRHFVDSEFRPAEGGYRLVVVRPDVLISTLTIGDAVEVRDDWTSQAGEHVLNAIVEHQRMHGAQTTVVATPADSGADPALLSDLQSLHRVVGRAIKLHKYSHHQQLPTKKNRFDWTLGDRAVEFGAATQHDYALFVHARDVYSSEGRLVLQLATLFLLPSDEFGWLDTPFPEARIAFASLVDLKTGGVVWFNELQSLTGDILSEKGARRMVADLLGPMRPNPSRHAGTRSPEAI